MAASGCAQQLPETPRLFQYLAVPTDDRGLAEAAKCCEANMKWAPQERDRATRRDWQAYQNLLQLTGILSTAGVGNARQVWKHVVDFVEMNDMVECEPPAKAARSSFVTAQDVLQQSQGSKQSPSPASGGPPKAEPFAGTSPKESSHKPPLSPAQIDRINASREQALARQALKKREEAAAQEKALAGAPVEDAKSGQSARSHK